METLTVEQQQMLKNGPCYGQKKLPSNKKKILVISLGVLAGAVAAYYIGPKVSGLIQARRIAKVAKVI